MTILSKTTKLFLTLLVILTVNAKATTLESIHNQIVKNRPKLNKSYVASLERAILKSCTTHKIPCDVFTAILMQESRYILDAFNPDTKDHGISQINEKTAIAFGFDIKKLHSNLEYSVEAGALVLADFRRMYGKKEELWWTRYNSSKPSQREIYKNLVAQYK